MQVHIPIYILVGINQAIAVIYALHYCSEGQCIKASNACFGWQHLSALDILRTIAAIL